MALSKLVTDILNKFADSQPALRIPGKPLAESNPMIGDAINTALTAASGGTTPSEVSDQIADEAAGADFTPTTSADWDTPPATIQEALDALAAAVKALTP